jgi:hypothetical protein
VEARPHLLRAGHIGCKGKDAPVRLGRQLSRGRLQRDAPFSSRKRKPVGKVTSFR